MTKIISNKEIANAFNALGKIMELHGENPFKIRSYYNAYNTLRKWPQPLVEMGKDEISKIKGVGNAISDKIQEFIETGELKTYKKYADNTPSGIIELLRLKGIGPKKIKLVWDELGVESAGELLYACIENRLVELKGFGAKSQAELKDQLEYALRSSSKYHYARVENVAIEMESLLIKHFLDERFALTGKVRQKYPIVEKIEILTTLQDPITQVFQGVNHPEIKIDAGIMKFFGIPVSFIIADPSNFVTLQLETSCSPHFYNAISQYLPERNLAGKSELELFQAMGIKYIPPELREDPSILREDLQWINQLIDDNSVRGVVHCHTTYSDGINSLGEMVDYSRELGYEYIVITDHSQSAFYADGLKEIDLVRQWNEIDNLNKTMEDFVIFKGIESDILSNGALDYPDEILQEFDVVIASIHSNLKMKEEKANMRLIKAIENPYTHILGHPTGRLLLSRKGYPIDHKKIIEACAANHVHIELNSNPYRLDLDWKWIDYAISKGILISINPDAHSKTGIHDIHFGVCVARKAGLTVEYCLNARDADLFSSALSKDKVGS